MRIRNRIVRGSVVAAATLLFVSLSPPSDALTGNYTIQVQQLGGGFYNVTTVAFTGVCNPALLVDGFNGLDARVLPIGAGERGHDLSINWSSLRAPLPVDPQIGLRAVVFDPACANAGNPTVVGTSVNPTSDWRVHIPANAGWLVIESIGEEQVNFHVTTL